MPAEGISCDAFGVSQLFEVQLAEGKVGGPGVRSLPGTERLTSQPHQCLPSVEAAAAYCFLLFLHCAVPVLDWLSWQLTHRCLCTFSRSKGAVLFPDKFLQCGDEAA